MTDDRQTRSALQPRAACSLRDKLVLGADGTERGNTPEPGDKFKKEKHDVDGNLFDCFVAIFNATS